MTIYRLVIADDDHPSREIIKHFISRLPQFDICGEASDGEELLELVLKLQPDLILLDINMPEMDGIEAMKSILSINPNANFIFITGHDIYAVEAFSLAAIDYIVKPIERSRLYIAMEKAEKTLSIKSEKNEHLILKKLMIKSKGSYHYIPLEEIIFIEKVGRKSLIHTHDFTHKTSESLESLFHKLDQRFINTHRSFIINIDHLANIKPVDETYTASFSHFDKKAIVSKHKISKIQQIIQGHTL